MFGLDFLPETSHYLEEKRIDRNKEILKRMVINIGVIAVWAIILWLCWIIVNLKK